VNLSQFAEAHRLKLTKDDCGDPVITGRIGQSNIYEHSPPELGVAFITDGKKDPRTGLFNTFKIACLSAGMNLRQAGDAEGVFTFDPGDREQATVAIKGIRARAKRRISPEQAARLAAIGFRGRIAPTVNPNAL
jgi:hypothetical protein